MQLYISILLSFLLTQLLYVVHQILQTKRSEAYYKYRSKLHEFKRKIQEKIDKKKNVKKTGPFALKGLKFVWEKDYDKELVKKFKLSDNYHKSYDEILW